jgi:hypothetical protein
VKATLACWLYRVGCGVTLFLCAVLWGCAGATRLPVRTQTPAGASIEKKEIDLAFVQVGTTHREEVANRLAAIDTSYSNPRLFWGRWSESRWGYWWLVVAPCLSCGSGGAAGDAKRIWHVQNMLVTFDENGAVTGKELIKDDDALWRALHVHMVEAPPPPLDLSQPIRVPLIGREPNAIVLSRDGMEFERSKKGKRNVQLSALKVIRFRHGRTLDKKTSPGVTCHTLEFSEKSSFGKKIRFCAAPAEVGTVFQYLQQAGSPAMSWQ